MACLETALGDFETHATSSRTSILPVTAAEIRAVRSSFRRSMASRIAGSRVGHAVVLRSNALHDVLLFPQRMDDTLAAPLRTRL